MNPEKGTPAYRRWIVTGAIKTLILVLFVPVIVATQEKEYFWKALGICLLIEALMLSGAMIETLRDTIRQHKLNRLHTTYNTKP